ncbi:uncharacterized protein LOC124639625 [Helicoverpa zea]|uniref:uncharacterized protein LOC124639625 n=1 Tax=Helicoverpa zea TaxID=7113 RepID=UPI001F5A6A40|nr:uncharacterized protein LOC124639625 [Helicoverpa zea]
MSVPKGKEQKCVGCKGILLKDKQITCFLCKSKYDLLCANITVDRFKLMDVEHKRIWRCPECRSKQPKADNTNTPIRAVTSPASETLVDFVTQPDSETSYITHRRKPTSDVPAPLVVLDPGLSKSDQVPYPDQEIGLFWNELRAARYEMSQLRDTLLEVTATMKTNSERLDLLEARIDGLESTIAVQDRSNMDILESQITQLKQDLQDREQELLSNDIEIAGVPETAGEGVVHIALAVATKLGVELDDRDIVSAARVGPPRAIVEGAPAPKPRSIAVRLTRRTCRDALLKAARVRRGVTTTDMGIAGKPCKFYVNERLTKLNRQIFQRARELAAHAKWRFVWTRDGKIFARKDNGSKRHRFSSETDLMSVFGGAVVCTDDV